MGGSARIKCRKPAREQGHLSLSLPSLTVGLLTQALSNLGAEFFLQQLDQWPMNLIDFFISQSSIVGAILKPQCHGSLIISNPLTFISADEGDAAEVGRLFGPHRAH